MERIQRLALIEYFFFFEAPCFRAWQSRTVPCGEGGAPAVRGR